MAHSFSSRVTIVPDVLFRVVGEETVLLNLNTELYLGFDTVGTQMWNALTQAGSIQDAYEALLKVYEDQAPAFAIVFNNKVTADIVLLRKPSKSSAVRNWTH